MKFLRFLGFLAMLFGVNFGVAFGDPYYTFSLNDQGGSGGKVYGNYLGAVDLGTAFGYLNDKFYSLTQIQTIPTPPANSYSHFGGYYTGQNGTGIMIVNTPGYFSSANDALMAITTNGTQIYAKWLPNFYRITLNDQGGSGGQAASDTYRGLFERYGNCFFLASILNNTELESAACATQIYQAPTRTGYNFSGYYTGVNGAGVQIVDSNRDIVGPNTQFTSDSAIYAKWEPKILTVTLNKNNSTNGSTNSVPTTVYLKYATGWYSNSGATTTISQLTTNPVRPGFAFNGYWTTAATTGGTQVINSSGTFLTSQTALTAVANNATVYARWTEVPIYTITLSPNGGSGSRNIYYSDGNYYCDTGATQIINSNASVFTTCGFGAPTLTNYEFNGYYSNLSNGTQYIGTDGKLTLAAQGLVINTNTTWYAQYIQTTSTQKCDCGYYIPAGATNCVQCPSGFYCSEGVWTVPVNYDQGISDCAKNCVGATSNAGACSATECYTTCNKECYRPNGNCPTQGANDCGYDTSVTVAGRIYVQSDGYCGTSCDYAILPANSSNNWCPITSCPANYYFTGGKLCTACDTGFSAPAGSTGPEDCTKTCPLNCIKPDCPAGVLAYGTCDYGTESGTGTMNQVDLECVGTAPTCSITPNCDTGYVPNLTNDACIAATYHIAYEKNGGVWPDSSCPGAGCPDTYTYGESDVIISTVPIRDNSVFLGWCTDAGLTNCAPTQTIGANETGDKTFWAKWKCVEPYHQNLDGNACEACPENSYFDPNSSTLCSQCPASFPNSTRPFNWSEDQCWRSCVNNASCQLAPASVIQDMNATCTATSFMSAAGTQIEFKGNAGSVTTCDATNVPYCPYGFECSAENVEMPRTAPVTFHWGNNLSALRHVVGLGRMTATGPIMTQGKMWSAIMGPAQQVEFQAAYDAYTFITYPTNVAPDASFAGHTFVGYYDASTGGNQYVADTGLLNGTNAQSVGVTLDNEIPGNRDLYAHYDESVYHITYEKNGGDWAPMSNCPGASGCPATYTYGTGATISSVPTRALSVFVGWCTDAGLTNCAPTQTIGANETGDKTFWAKWECVEPYHQNAAGTMCEACDDNQYWSGSACLNCGEGAATGFPFSKSPFNWSVDQCYRDCPNTTCLSDGNLGNEFPSSCNIVGFSNSNRQVDFKGNNEAGVDSCSAVQYCPYGLMHCDIAEAFKPMSAPVDFYGKIPQELIDTYYIFGKRSGGDSIDLGTANVWSQIVGPAQKGPVNHNTIGGQLVDYQYTYIFYPTYTAPNADVPGYTFTGYYHPQTGGTQYVGQNYALNTTNAQSVISGITGYDSNTARPLYANPNNGYTPNTYTVTYKCGAGQGADMNDPNGATYGQTYTVLGLGNTNCSYTGHEFLGWVFSGDENMYSGGDTFAWNYPSAQTFTAQWSGASPYTITYKPNYTGATQSDQTQNVTYGQSFTTLGAVFTRPGYIMTAWSEPFPLLGHEYQSYNIADNTTLLAQWEQCPAGTFWNNGTCEPCPEGTTSPAGSTSSDQCVPCGDGYYLNNVTCEGCPEGYPHSDPNATQQSQCYQDCETPCTEPVSCPVPNAATCTYGTNPNPGHLYYGTQACNAPALTCPVSAFTCLPGYVVNAAGDACEPCPEGTIPNAAGTACEPCPAGTYWVSGTCEPCPEGYTSNPGSIGSDACEPVCDPGQHFMHGECEDNEVSCTAPHATVATRTWNTLLRAYESCQIQECEDGYHVASNACVLDEQLCTVPNGRGERAWDGSAWGDCTVTQCNPGFEISGNTCVECPNRIVNGEVAVSSYASGCEIATCMYHGQKYVLENDVCRPICEDTEDETGSKHWDNSLKKCVRTCNAGYKMW